MPVFRALIILSSLLFGLATPGAMALDGPLGIAAVLAPEAGGGICFDADASEALACAREKCMTETGFGLEDCQATTVCLPALWSVDIFMQHEEGPHWHNFSCGWQSREQLEAVVEVACDVEWLIECTAVQVWSPDGSEVALME